MVLLLAWESVRLTVAAEMLEQAVVGRRLPVVLPGVVHHLVKKIKLSLESYIILYGRGFTGIVSISTFLEPSMMEIVFDAKLAT